MKVTGVKTYVIENEPVLETQILFIVAVKMKNGTLEVNIFLFWNYLQMKELLD